MSRRARVLLAAGMIMAASACTTTTPTNAPPSSSPPTPGQTIAPTVSDVAYAHTSPEQLLDLYLPSGNTPAPLVIWIHGGGWRTGDKAAIATVPDLTAPLPQRTDCRDIVQVQVPNVVTLNAKGYAVAAINYRIDHDPVAAVQDAKAAVRFLRANAARYHLNPNQFAAWGDSAGGYSAIMLAITATKQTVFDSPDLGNPNVSTAIQAVVDWYGASDLPDLAGNPGPAESPFTYIAKGQRIPPFLIAQGDQDCVVPVQHSQHLYQALKAAGVTATLNILHGAGHEDPAFMRTQSTPALEFLDHTLKHH